MFSVALNTTKLWIRIEIDWIRIEIDPIRNLYLDLTVKKTGSDRIKLNPPFYILTFNENNILKSRILQINLTLFMLSIRIEQKCKAKIATHI